MTKKRKRGGEALRGGCPPRGGGRGHRGGGPPRGGYGFPARGGGPRFPPHQEGGWMEHDRWMGPPGDGHEQNFLLYPDSRQMSYGYEPQFYEDDFPHLGNHDSRRSRPFRPARARGRRAAPRGRPVESVGRSSKAEEDGSMPAEQMVVSVDSDERTVTTDATTTFTVTIGASVEEDRSEQHKVVEQDASPSADVVTCCQEVAEAASSNKGPDSLPAKTTAAKKLPPGRFEGVIAFVGESKGIIERDDLKSFPFTFPSFYDHRKFLIPGVKVHFTVFKQGGFQKKDEVATDVKVAPGGTEQVDPNLLPGVIIKTHTSSKGFHGMITSDLSGQSDPLPFGKGDFTGTMFKHDRVEFQLVTDLLTREKKATNVKAVVPLSFQFTKEKRQKGVVMDIHYNVLTILSESNNSIKADSYENLSGDDLKVTDEVEFTSVEEGAVRLLKLPQGSVTFSSGDQPKVAQNASKVKEVASKPVQAGSKPSTAQPAQKPMATLVQKPTSTAAQKTATAPAQKASAAPAQKPTATPALKPGAAPAQKPTATPAQKTATAQKTTPAPAQKAAATPAQKAAATPAQKAAASPAQKAAASPAQKAAASPAQKPAATPAQKTATGQKTTTAPAQKAVAAPAQKAAATPAQKAAASPAQKPAATPAQKTATGQKTTTAPTQKAVAAPAQKAAAVPAQKPTATPAQKPAATSAQKPTATPAQKTAAAPAQKNAASAAQKPTATEKAAAAPVQKASATPATAQTQKTAAASAQKPPPTPAQKTAAAPAQKALATPAQKAAGTPAQKPTATQTQKPLATPAPKTTTAPAQKPPATPAQKAAAAQPSQKAAVAPAQKTPATPAQKAPAATAVPKPTDTSALKSAATQPAGKAAAAPVQKVATVPKSGNSSGTLEGVVLTLPARGFKGSLCAVVEGEEKQLGFSSGEVLTKATMMIGDKVQFKLVTDPRTKTQRASMLKILPDTFLDADTQEQRKTGVVVSISGSSEFGYIKPEEGAHNARLYFLFSEVMEEKRLRLQDKVEFSVVPTRTEEHAIRIRRCVEESVFTPAPKLDSIAAKPTEKKKITINLAVNAPPETIKPTAIGSSNTEESSVCTEDDDDVVMVVMEEKGKEVIDLTLSEGEEDVIDLTAKDSKTNGQSISIYMDHGVAVKKELAEGNRRESAKDAEKHNSTQKQAVGNKESVTQDPGVVKEPESIEGSNTDSQAQPVGSKKVEESVKKGVDESKQSKGKEHSGKNKASSSDQRDDGQSHSQDNTGSQTQSIGCKKVSESVKEGVDETKQSKEHSGKNKTSINDQRDGGQSCSQDKDDRPRSQSSGKEVAQEASKESGAGLSRSREHASKPARSRSREDDRSKAKEDSGKKSSSSSQKSDRNRDGGSRSDHHRSRRSSSTERRRGRSKERGAGDRRARSRSRERSHRSRSSSRERRRGRSKERSDRDRSWRSRSRDRDRERERERDREKEKEKERERNREKDRERERDLRRRSQSPNHRGEGDRRRSRSRERPFRQFRRSTSSSPKRPTAATVSMTALNFGSGVGSSLLTKPTSFSGNPQAVRREIVDKELERKRKELEEVQEQLARKRAIASKNRALELEVTRTHEPFWGSQSRLTDEPEIPLLFSPSRESDQGDRLPKMPIKSILKKPKQFFEPEVSLKDDDDGPPPQKIAIYQAPSGNLFPIPMSSNGKGSAPPQQCSVPYSSHMVSNTSASVPACPALRETSTINPSVSVHPAVWENTLSNTSVSAPARRPLRDSPPSNMSVSASAHPALWETPTSNTSVSASPHPALWETPSERRFTEPPLRRYPLSPPRGQEEPEQQRPEVSSNMARFISLLNKGVDSNLLSKIGKEAQKESAAIQQKPHGMSPHGDECYDPFKEDQEYLLPHEMPVEDGSGFSRVLSLKTGQLVEEQFLRKSSVDEEEDFLYGEQGTGQQHRLSVAPQQVMREERASGFSQRDEVTDTGGREMGKDQMSEQVHNFLKFKGVELRDSEFPYGEQGTGRQHRLSVAPQQVMREERAPGFSQRDEVTDTGGREMGKDLMSEQVHNFLKFKGVELRDSEFTQVMNRVKELTDKKRLAAIERQKRNRSPVDQRDRTSSPDSDRFRSTSPEKQSKRRVLVKYDPLGGLTKTFLNKPSSPEPESSPESASNPARLLSSTSSQFSYPEPESTSRPGNVLLSSHMAVTSQYGYPDPESTSNPANVLPVPPAYPPVTSQFRYPEQESASSPAILLPTAHPPVPSQFRYPDPVPTSNPAQLLSSAYPPAPSTLSYSHPPVAGYPYTGPPGAVPPHTPTTFLGSHSAMPPLMPQHPTLPHPTLQPPTFQPPMLQAPTVQPPNFHSAMSPHPTQPQTFQPSTLQDPSLQPLPLPSPLEVQHPYSLAAGQTYLPQTYPAPTYPAPTYPAPTYPTPTYPTQQVCQPQIASPTSSSYSGYPPVLTPIIPTGSTTTATSGNVTPPILVTQPLQNTVKQQSAVKMRNLKVVELQPYNPTPSEEAGKSSAESNASSDPTAVQPTPATQIEKQKKKLEQFSQRWKQNNKKLMEARQESGKKDSTTGNVASSKGGGKNVWICGHSLVALAEKKANSSASEFGMQLGLDPKCVKVWWKGLLGMTCDQLGQHLHQLKLTWPNPDMLIVHLGGNDISRTPDPEQLLSKIKRDLTSVRYLLPSSCKLVWSTILPRRFWKQGGAMVDDVHKMVDRQREMINARMHAVMAELGGAVITHNNIRPELYRPDGIHLSGRGIDTFNNNIKDFLMKWNEEEEEGSAS